MGLATNIKAFKANIAFNKGDYGEALNLYKELVSKKKIKNSVLLQAAYTAINCGENFLCKEFLDKIDTKSLESTHYKISYKQTEALHLWKTGNLTQAIEILKDLSINNENTATYETLGLLLIVSGNYDEALEYNLKAYDYTINNVITDNLAESYYYLGNLKKAKELYENILLNSDKPLPTFPEAYYYYGLILKSENNLEEATKYFNIALEKKESNLSILTHDIIRKEL